MAEIPSEVCHAFPVTYLVYMTKKVLYKLWGVVFAFAPPLLWL
jgi:hypothetical protein